MYLLKTLKSYPSGHKLVENTWIPRVSNPQNIRRKTMVFCKLRHVFYPRLKDVDETRVLSTKYIPVLDVDIWGKSRGQDTKYICGKLAVHIKPVEYWWKTGGSCMVKLVENWWHKFIGKLGENWLPQVLNMSFSAFHEFGLFH